MWGAGKSMYQIQATVAMEQQHMTTDQASHYAATAAGFFFFYAQLHAQKIFMGPSSCNRGDNTVITENDVDR